VGREQSGGGGLAERPASPILLVLSGEPRGKGRPRFGQGRTWTDKDTALAEGNIIRKWEDVGEPRLPDNAPLRVHVTLYISRPNSHYKRDGSLSAEGLRHPRPENKKPDVDNALKLVMDALNKRAYKDDVQIVEATVERQWAEWPATKIAISVI
jgi:Holliday junction resolvase RusA-like endonuclease